MGIAVQDLSSLSLERVEVLGALVDGAIPATVPLPPYSCETADPATHGIVAVDVRDATLRDVETDGFAAYGALFVGTTFPGKAGAPTGISGAGSKRGRAPRF